MSDYNDGLLPEPCLRMDTHFGDEYESVEFGDGTGYVKAAPMLAMLGAFHVGLDELRDENVKLRELLLDYDKMLAIAADELAYKSRVLRMDSVLNALRIRLHKLGIEVDDAG